MGVVDGGEGSYGCIQVVGGDVAVYVYGAVGRGVSRMGVMGRGVAV